MSKLIDIAKKFETKLGMPEDKTASANSTSGSEKKLPKSLRKIAAAELFLQKTISKRYADLHRVYGEVTVKTASGSLPAVFHICPNCAGRGKVADSDSTETIKLASTGEDVPTSKISNCPECKGKRVIKTVDAEKCSPEELTAYASFDKVSKKEKAQKKAEKAKKKAAKAIAKAEVKHLEAQDPEGALKSKVKRKAEKKAMKAAKKAEKKIKKAHKAAHNAAAKAGFPE